MRDQDAEQIQIDWAAPPRMTKMQRRFADEAARKPERRPIHPDDQSFDGRLGYLVFALQRTRDDARRQLEAMKRHTKPGPEQAAARCMYRSNIRQIRRLIWAIRYMERTGEKPPDA